MRINLGVPPARTPLKLWDLKIPPLRGLSTWWRHIFHLQWLWLGSWVYPPPSPPRRPNLPDGATSTSEVASPFCGGSTAIPPRVSPPPSSMAGGSPASSSAVSPVGGPPPTDGFPPPLHDPSPDPHFNHFVDHHLLVDGHFREVQNSQAALGFHLQGHLLPPMTTTCYTAHHHHEAIRLQGQLVPPLILLPPH